MMRPSLLSMLAGTGGPFKPVQPYSGTQFPIPYSPFHYQQPGLTPWTSSRLPKTGPEQPEALPTNAGGMMPTPVRMPSEGGQSEGKETPGDPATVGSYDISPGSIASGAVRGGLTALGTINPAAQLVSLGNTLMGNPLGKFAANQFSNLTAADRAYLDSTSASVDEFGDPVQENYGPQVDANAFGGLGIDSTNLDVPGENYGPFGEDPSVDDPNDEGDAGGK